MYEQIYQLYLVFVFVREVDNIFRPFLKRKFMKDGCSAC